jgi:hypothetical protein
MANPKYAPMRNYRNFRLWNHQVAAFPLMTNLCRIYFLGRMPYNEKKT